MSSSLKNPPFVIGMPTETVYGLAARIDLEDGIRAIFRIKERPFFDPLIVHVNSIEQAKGLVKSWPQVAEVLAQKFWPGPLTLVLPKSEQVSPLITSGLETVGIRMPRHPLALDLIRREGVALAAPSANKFGRTSPTTAQHVKTEFGAQFPVLDGGPCEVGLESTVLLIKPEGTEPTLSILRPGGVTRLQINQCLASKDVSVLWTEAVDKKESPGHMKHHYMPEVPLILVSSVGLSEPEIIERVRENISQLPNEIEGVKIIKPSDLLNKIAVLNLSDDPAVASRQFYSQLRELAAAKPDLILFYKMEIHHGEIWQALFDRLTKAASLIV